MGTSKLQRARVVVTCACGCGETFSAFPVYRSKAEGGGLRVPEYKRGHHPNQVVNRTGTKPAWNKGLTKEDHPSITRMGFQPGHEPYNDWSKVNELLRSKLEIRLQWLNSKRGQVLNREQYPKGIASGAKHGNWKGGHRGSMDTAEWQRLRGETLKRDNYTCQDCGDKNRKGRGARINLEVHHIIAVCESPEHALDPNNLITLCRNCHYRTHNYGAKGAKRSGK
ncbi:MAG: HNH endonuclease [Gammaproteobacteria bacterium]